ncbi:MAG TPA: beta-ketoacyl synthase chain length factor [Puia sp.]|nr:beta-ketoacyl synthase chain length factor [Puia sp.]
MFYIHHTTCISPQQTYPEVRIGQLIPSVDNKLKAIEPSYDGVPANVLRRMSKSVKLAVGAALPILKQINTPDGILIGTGNGGMEDSVRFLKQVIEYNEEALAPGTFVQSTPNAIASQIALSTHNKGYNITHVHRGLAFENTVIDVAMLLMEHPQNNYLLGGVDEISSYNFNLECLEGWYKKEDLSNKDLYETDTPGSIAGEGAVLFHINGIKANARARLGAVSTLHSHDEHAVRDQLNYFIRKYIPTGEEPDLLMTGENGDIRLLKFYTACESAVAGDVAVARFKHMSGEYPTAQAFAVWLACQILDNQHLPSHMLKKSTAAREFRNIIIYNNHKGIQHSFTLVSKAGEPGSVSTGI